MATSEALRNVQTCKGSRCEL